MKEIIYQGTNMVKTFGETTVLQGISLKLYKGDFTVIMGSSGSGKSTLLYAISGMDRLSGGQLFYKGKQSDGKTSSDGMLDIAHASEKELTRLRAENFGFVFQRTHLVSSLTLEENIRMAGADLRLHDRKADSGKNRCLDLPNALRKGKRQAAGTGFRWRGAAGGRGKGSRYKAKDFVCGRTDRSLEQGKYRRSAGSFDSPLYAGAVHSACDP